MKRNPTLALVALLACGLLALPAQADNLKDADGYVDLEWIQIPADAEEIQDIDLGAVLIGMAAQAEEKGDDALLKALSMIKSVRVRAFSLDDDSDDVKQAVDRVASRLKNDDWQHLIYVKDDEETITVSTKSVNDKMVGLMLVTYEPGDSVAFVNVVGDLDLATLLGMVGEFDSENLEEILEGIEMDVDDD